MGGIHEFDLIWNCRIRGDLEGMIDAAVALVLANEDRPLCELVRGDVYRELGMADQALASYRQVLRIQAADAAPRLQELDEAIGAAGSVAEALELCMESLAIRGEAREAAQAACDRMEEIHVEAGDIERAIDVCRQRVEVLGGDGDPEPLCRLAQRYSETGNGEEAVRWAAMAAQEAPERADLWLTLGRYQVEGGWYAEATQSLLEAVLLDRWHGEAYWFLGCCYSLVAAALEGGPAGRTAASDLIRTAAEQCRQLAWGCTGIYVKLTSATVD